MFRLTNDIYSEKVLEEINKKIQKIFAGCDTDKDIATRFLDNNGQTNGEFWERGEDKLLHPVHELVNLNYKEIKLTNYEIDGVAIKLFFNGEDDKQFAKFVLRLDCYVYGLDDIVIRFHEYEKIVIYERIKG